MITIASFSVHKNTWSDCHSEAIRTYRSQAALRRHPWSVMTRSATT
jgi:hypothetical protein